MSSSSTSPRPANRLGREKSPYLLQHAHNPVDWFPWGDEAFKRARTEEKPIFLSIGYSTCHWCHVMERESFENDALAAVLNAHFVCIKVDREERPDVDKIYMAFVQATTGSGGWPLNVFLTPDLKPFFGGTYFPPDHRQGRPSFQQLLQQIQHLWETRRADVHASAADLHQRLSDSVEREVEPGLALTTRVITDAGQKLKEGFDAVHGGWGTAPKFPSPSHPAFVLSQGVKQGDDEAVQMVLHTCERMAAGGIHDQLGGGFARYSVDREWLVPHFEKMLYDNAQLTNLYLDAFRVSGEARFAEVARDIVRYVLRDMTHPEGGFYSAEDADSEGKEGKFYCWTHSELAKLLSPEEFNVAVKYFGVTRGGNFLDHSDPDPLPSQNVLSVADPHLGPGDEVLLRAAKEKMIAARSQRVRPQLDDKVLASWNGLMLGAMARVYAVLGDEQYRNAAEKNLAFLQAKLWEPTGPSDIRHPASGVPIGTLHHRWRDGERDAVQLLDAYAFLLGGVIDLYEATLEANHLEFAVALADAMIARFHDPEHGGFWQSEATPDLILRVKEDYDGAEPSGNSVAILSLLRLAAITARSDYREAAERTLRLFADRLQRFPQALPAMLTALAFSVTEPTRVVIAGDPATAKARELLRAVHAVYQPHGVILGVAGPVDPFARTLPTNPGEAMAYLCSGQSCQPPTGDPKQLQEQLRRRDG